MVFKEVSDQERITRESSGRPLDPTTWSIGLLGRRRRFYLLPVAQLLGDIVVVFLSFTLAFVMFAGWPPSMGVADWHAVEIVTLLSRLTVAPEFRAFLPLLAAALVIYPANLAFFRVYSTLAADLRPFSSVRGIAKGAVGAAIIIGLLAFAGGASRYGGETTAPALFTLYFVYLALLMFFGSLLAHSGTLIGLLYLQCLGMGRIRSAAVADKDTAAEIARTLRAPTSAHFYVGTVTPQSADTASGGERILGHVGELAEVINKHNLSELILAVDPGDLSTAERLAIAQTCWNLGTQLKMVTPFHPYFRTEARTEHFGDLSLLHVERAGLYARPSQLAKRALDVGLSLFGIIATSPILVATAIAIKLDSPGPVLFKQERVGLNGRLFKVWKFRSMRQDADPKLHAEFLKKVIERGQEDLQDKTKTVSKIPDDPRITKVGKFIRRTSIDELPQFFNVLRGEMSLVGPRPELPYAVELYNEWHRRRLNIRPGMTGLWQVSGRSRLTYEQMFELDIRYAEDWSLWLDFWIIAMTLPVLLKMDDTT